jgi:hypothetical protein
VTSEDGNPPATVLMVFGRGLVRAGNDYTLTPAGTARVRAAVAYVAAHEAAFTGAAQARIVFTGGWPEASEGMAPPPAGAREGDLMLREAYAAGLERHAHLYAETRSRSTLENLLHTAADGLLDGYTFDAAHPLGLVSHAAHLRRIRLLAGKALGLRGPALRDVPAAGPDGSDRLALLTAHIGFLGAGGAAHLLRRERRIVALSRALRKVRRPGAGDQPS